MKTSGVVFPGAGRFELRELTLKEMGPGEISVRTLVTAVSPGTERWILKGRHQGTKFPCIPGYQSIGIVEKKGKHVKDFNEGDIVYGGSGGWKENIFSMWGGHCGYSVGSPGGYRFVSSRVPDIAELEAAAFTMIAAVGYKGIRFLELGPGEKVLIIGAGFIGICAAQLAVLREAKPLFIDTDPERISFAKKLGFEAFNPEEEASWSKIGKIAAGGLDAIYDSAGVPAAVDMAVGHAKKRGRLLLQAQYFDRESRTMDIDRIKTREMTVKTTCGVDNVDWDAAFTEIKKRRLRISPLVTQRFLSSDCLEGYRILLGGQPFNLGMVFFWESTLLENHPAYRRGGKDG